MALPIATTTVSVLRRAADPTADTEDVRAAYSVLTAGVRAHFYLSGAAEMQGGGSLETINDRANLDPTNVTHYDRITDDFDGKTYEVDAVIQRHGLGLDYTACEVRLVEGER